MRRSKRFGLRVVILVVVCLVVSSTYPHSARATGALTALSDTMSRQQKSTVKSNHTIKFTTPSGVDAGETITITMPTGFAIGTVDYTDIDVSWGASTGYENELTLAATPSGATWGAAFASQVLTITSGTGTITATSKVVVEIGLNAASGDQQITNHATAATYTITIAGTFNDTGSIAIVVLDTDQFTVTASVDPTLTFSLSATSTDFGTLSTSSVITSSPNITLTTSTNATSGYTISILDTGSGANPGLYNSTAAFTIGSGDYSYANSADLASVAGYGIQCASATATCASPYNVSGTNVGGYEITAQTLATYVGVASAQTVTVTSKAKVSAVTSAGAYTDTATVLVTGNF